MKKSELKQIIKEEIKKSIIENKNEIEWKDISNLFRKALDEIQSHDQYAYADKNEINSILNGLIIDLQDIFGDTEFEFGK